MGMGIIIPAVKNKNKILLNLNRNLVNTYDAIMQVMPIKTKDAMVTVRLFLYPVIRFPV